MMRRGTIFVILFILIAAGVIGVSQFLRSQPPLEMTIAVDPLAEAWARSVVEMVNAGNPVVNATQRILFRVERIDDMAVWQGQRPWTVDNHPVAWIPASSLSLRFALENGLPVAAAADSLARTPLVWVVYESRADVLAADGQPFDWAQTAAAAQAESWSTLGAPEAWRFVKLGIPQPGSKIGGLAALLTGTASFSDNPALSRDAVSSRAFRDWMLPVLKANYDGGGDVITVMAAQGASTVEIGLFPESALLANLNGITANEAVRVSYPAYQFILDFPLARWTDANTTEAEREAVTLLQNALLGQAAQARLPDFGLRPAVSEPTDSDRLFAAGLPFGVLLTPDYGQAVTPPARGDVLGFIQWAANQ